MVKCVCPACRGACELRPGTGWAARPGQRGRGCGSSGGAPSSHSLHPQALLAAPALLEQLTCAPGSGELGRILAVPRGQQAALQGYRDAVCSGQAAARARRFSGLAAELRDQLDVAKIAQQVRWPRCQLARGRVPGGRRCQGSGSVPAARGGGGGPACAWASGTCGDARPHPAPAPSQGSLTCRRQTPSAPRPAGPPPSGCPPCPSLSLGIHQPRLVPACAHTPLSPQLGLDTPNGSAPRQLPPPRRLQALLEDLLDAQKVLQDVDVLSALALLLPQGACARPGPGPPGAPGGPANGTGVGANATEDGAPSAAAPAASPSEALQGQCSAFVQLWAALQPILCGNNRYVGRGPGARPTA